MHGECRLCLKLTELQHSHIIPKFVVKWLKDSSPGYIRTNNDPNRRIQDGYKEYFLCRDCEQLFSKWEDVFFKRIFSPLHSTPPSIASISYTPWFLKFAVSIAWRVLLYRINLGIPYLTDEQLIMAEQAKKVWRKFLLGGLQDLGEFTQHLLPLDVVQSNYIFNNSPFINRYILSTIDLDVVSWKPTPTVAYAKLGRLLFFGVIQDEHGNIFKGTKIQNKGILKQPTVYEVSSLILNHIGERANRTGAAASSMSLKQQSKIEQMVKDNIEKVETSEYLRGLKYDKEASRQT
jgi:hypothetical protein